MFHLHRLEQKNDAAYFQGVGSEIPCRRENIYANI